MKERFDQKRPRRTGRKLLVAAAGVASISYVGLLEGCAGQVDSSVSEDDVTKAAPEWGDGGVEEAEADGERKALSTKATTAATALKPVQPVGNLMPPGGEGNVVVRFEQIRVPIPVGNLMVTPVDQLEVRFDQQAALEQALKGTTR